MAGQDPKYAKNAAQAAGRYRFMGANTNIGKQRTPYLNSSIGSNVNYPPFFAPTPGSGAPINVPNIDMSHASVRPKPLVVAGLEQLSAALPETEYSIRQYSDQISNQPDAGELAGELRSSELGDAIGVNLTALYSDSPIDLEGEDLKRFVTIMIRMLRYSENERSSLVSKADRDEVSYNLEPYQDSDKPATDAVSIRLPLSLAKVDKMSSDLAATYDRDGAPIYRAIPGAAYIAELAKHHERQIHEILTAADAMRHIRHTIKRATKVGTAFVWTEVVSEPVRVPAGGEALLSELGQTPTESENAIEITACKMQDMYIYPLDVNNLHNAPFIGHRFQMPRWKLEDMQSDNYFAAKPVDVLTGQETMLTAGYKDTFHGKNIESTRAGIIGMQSTDTPADQYDLIRAYIRFKPDGESRTVMFSVVFPINNPSLILRLKRNPYPSLDRAPVEVCNVDEGDGIIFGRSIMALVADLNREADQLHMTRLLHAKNAATMLHLVRAGSELETTLSDRRNQSAMYDTAVLGSDSGWQSNGLSLQTQIPAARLRVYAGEWLSTEYPERDLVSRPQALPISNMSMAEENRIQQYIADATIETAPLGGIRSAFEVRYAAGQMASKMKAYLKVVASTLMRPLIETVRAMVWDYMMPDCVLSPGQIRFMRVGDTLHPIHIVDYFRTIQMEPAGTTTAADEVVAVTNSAELMNQVLPAILQIPGIVPDPMKAAREILKYRVASLGVDVMNEIIGLAEPTQQDIEKSVAYLTMLKQLNGQAELPQNALGGDGDIPLGLGRVVGGPKGGERPVPGAPPQSLDQTGGSQTGVAPILNPDQTPNTPPV